MVKNRKIHIVGAGLSCFASIIIGFMPFVVLEATWTVVAIAGLIRLFMRN